MLALRCALLVAPPPQPEALGAALLQGLSQISGAALLILDDYRLAPPESHALAALLVERRSPTLHLLLTCRDEPPLPLARWRARGLLAELRADALRFDGGEAAALLNRTLGLALEPAMLDALTSLTEGWAAVLHLAGLAARAAQRRSRPARRLSRRTRLPGRQGLARERAEIQTFLRSTAIVERLSADLCHTLLEGEPAVQRPATELLRALEQANLFIVPLDEERRWYRYHPLFAAPLRS